MKSFLQKFSKIITETEKKFEQNTQRLLKFNHLLYEYENLSLVTYSPYIDSSQPHPEQHKIYLQNGPKTSFSQDTPTGRE